MIRNKQKKVKISKLYEFDGLNKVEVKEAASVLSLQSPVLQIFPSVIRSVRRTIRFRSNSRRFPSLRSQCSSLSTTVRLQDEGKFVTSRHLRDRLFRELNTDVSLRVEETDNTDSFKVSGRGELHLSVLVENMRREGYEFAVSKAEFFTKKTKTASSSSQWKPYTLMYRMNLQV